MTSSTFAHRIKASPIRLEGAVLSPGVELSEEDVFRNILFGMRLRGVERFAEDDNLHRGFRVAIQHLVVWYGDSVDMEYMLLRQPIGSRIPGLTHALRNLYGIWLQLQMPAGIWLFDVSEEYAAINIMGQPNSPHTGLRSGHNGGLSLELWSRLGGIVVDVAGLY